jgi:Flp pilus assembly protein TadD
MGDSEERAAPAVLPDESPGGEMIQGLSVPSLAVLDAPDGKPTGAAPTRDRNDLLETARAAFDGRRFDEAVSTADVILLLYPGDPEAQEIRGRALVDQGDAEGGRADLAACCGAGRASCCE